MGRTVVKWITSTDHKTIGYLYLITAFFWFVLAGAMALVIRAELATPGAAAQASSRTCAAPLPMQPLPLLKWLMIRTAMLTSAPLRP